MTQQLSVSSKEPWLAVTLSTILPGIGQIYAGKTVRGCVFVCLAIALLATSGWGLISATGSLQLGIQAALIFLLLNFFNLFDAHRCARTANNSEFEAYRKSHKDPWLAVFLSNLLPGLGHAYQGLWLPAIFFFVSTIVLRGLSSVNPLWLVLLIGLIIFCIYHVYVHSIETGHSRELIVAVCLALIAASIFGTVTALVLRSSIAEARFTPSGSMEPTLQIGDRFVVEKLSYRFNMPERGDIIIFQAPQTALESSGSTTGTALVKRIIGLPSDTVEVKAGEVFINEAALEENYVQSPIDYVWGPEVVPEGNYFVLGDNRNSSLDSHMWGFLPEDNIIGKASKIFWPPARQGVIK